MSQLPFRSFTCFDNSGPGCISLCFFRFPESFPLHPPPFYMEFFLRATSPCVIYFGCSLAHSTAHRVVRRCLLSPFSPVPLFPGWFVFFHSVHLIGVDTKLVRTNFKGPTRTLFCVSRPQTDPQTTFSVSGPADFFLCCILTSLATRKNNPSFF